MRKAYISKNDEAWEIRIVENGLVVDIFEVDSIELSDNK
jgi:hypothetical protein